ncbi:unnamed protein product [Aphanomyces euteiches]
MKIRAALLGLFGGALAVKGPHYDAKSGIPAFVDVDTPQQYYTTKSSRGETWDLVMSDEFNRPGRNFTAGVDPLWTAIEMPDGVNAALEYYSINMTETAQEPDGRGVFRIKTQLDDISFRVYNPYKQPEPGYQQSRMYYRSGMLQSWNKFCFQGGLVEVSSQQPGVTSAINPDAAGDAKTRVTAGYYYPTWPGVWLMGNLGRALFLPSTNRMWPWSYNECNENLKKDQRISACNSNPGFGLNPNQGRGAPEIDIFEGGGNAISSSVQIAPGMPDNFRPVPDAENIYCIYSNECKTPGANSPDVPSSITQQRGHRSWYQGLRYAPHVCNPKGTAQNALAINASLDAGITVNACTDSICPASRDVNGDRGPIDGVVNGANTKYWNINSKAECFPVMNGYNGAFLCDPYTNNSKCSAALHTDGTMTAAPVPPFSYQMDAISANWDVDFYAYSNYYKYQLEWVTGRQGYVRWMIDGAPLFEIPAQSLESPPQDSAKSNPRKLMIEEPLYFIFNTALSTSWGTKPPNLGKPCRGDGTDAKVNAVCDQFPLYLRIDYIRVWQNRTSMGLGCDPPSHPTRLWIDGHASDYQDNNNLNLDVDGQAFCNSNDDCTLQGSIVTGSCGKNSRCVCSAPKVWGGPRCTTNRGVVSGSSTSGSLGPPLWAVLVISVLATGSAVAIVYIRGKGKRLQLRFRSTLIRKQHILIHLSTGNLYAEAAAPASKATMPQDLNLRGTVMSRQGSMEETTSRTDVKRRSRRAV